jgi:hypothetical protein
MARGGAVWCGGGGRGRGRGEVARVGVGGALMHSGGGGGARGRRGRRDGRRPVEEEEGGDRRKKTLPTGGSHLSVTGEKGEGEVGRRVPDGPD